MVQTVESLRSALEQELWAGTLPGERILTETLGVSRPTLRAALEILEKERWIKTTSSRPRVILNRPSAPPKRPLRKVILLAKEPEQEMARMSLLYVKSLRQKLEGAGMEFEFLYHPRFSQNSSLHISELLPRPNAATVFILFSIPRAIQLYCQKSGYSAVIAGSSAKGIRFPSLDADYRGAARHAAGVFLGRGHRRIALFIRDSGLAGDAMTEVGFLEGARVGRDRGVVAKVILHSDDSEAIQRKLKSLMRNPAHRPTGILVGRAHHAVTVLCTLQSLGFKVPEDVSLICRDADFGLDWTVPRISCYQYSAEKFATQLTKIVAEMIAGGRIPSGAKALPPTFHEKDSLGKVR